MKPLKIKMKLNEKELAECDNANEKIDYINQVFWAKITQEVIKWASENIIIDLQKKTPKGKTYYYDTDVYIITSEQFRALSSGSTLSQGVKNGEKI